MFGTLKEDVHPGFVECSKGLVMRRTGVRSMTRGGRLHLLWERSAAHFRRSRLLKLAVTVIAWFFVSGALGAANWYFDGGKHPLAVYIYNAFTVFSNLNDDLGLVIIKGDGPVGLGINFPAMCISVSLIIFGMMGIALLTATLTSGSLNMDEEQFDRQIDEFRRLAVAATARTLPEDEPVDAHRILRMVISGIYGNILPFRSRTSLHQINIYEFEYILVNIINRIIESRRLLSDPPQCFLAYDLSQINAIVEWFGSLDYLYAHLSDPHHSPITDSFKHAWKNFSVELAAKVRAASASEIAA